MNPLDAAYETRDANARLILWLLLAIFVLLAGAAAGLRVILLSSGYRDSRMVHAAPPEANKASREPGLQAYPRFDGEAFRKEQAKALQQFGWSNREQGLVRVPIKRAMEILAARREVLEKGAQP